MEDPDEATPSHSIQNEEEIPQSSRYSESDLPPIGPVLKDVDSQDPQQQKSKCGTIPHHHYEIKGEAFMVAPQDDDEPRTIEEALSSFISKEWTAAMHDEIESMFMLCKCC